MTSKQTESAMFLRTFKQTGGSNRDAFKKLVKGFLKLKPTGPSKTLEGQRNRKTLL